MIAQPVLIESYVNDADVPTDWTMETVAGNYLSHGRRPAINAHIKIKDLLPHGNEEASMPLLTGVFLRDLQFDCGIRFLQPAEQRRDGLPDLKVNRSVFNLHNDIVIKLAIQRMKNVIRCFRAIVLQVGPIQMVVIDKCTVEDDPMGRIECARDDVGRISGSAAVKRRTQASFGIGLDDY